MTTQFLILWIILSLVSIHRLALKMNVSAIQCLCIFSVFSCRAVCFLSCWQCFGSRASRVAVQSLVVAHCRDYQAFGICPGPGYSAWLSRPLNWPNSALPKCGIIILLFALLLPLWSLNSTRDSSLRYLQLVSGTTGPPHLNANRAVSRFRCKLCVGWCEPEFHLVKCFYHSVSLYFW